MRHVPGLTHPIDTLACTRSPWICSETCYLVKFPNPSIWYLSDIKMSEGLAQNRSNLLCIYEAALDNEGCIWRRNNIYMKCFDRKVIWLIFPNLPVLFLVSSHLNILIIIGVKLSLYPNTDSLTYLGFFICWGPLRPVVLCKRFHSHIT